MNLPETHPHLVSEWHPTKNTAQIESVTKGSHVKAWWVCPENHEWQAPVHNRVKGSGCPYCAGKRILPGYNDLATTHPHLTKEWHNTLNSFVTPAKVTAGTGRKIWWVCKQEHVWEAAVNNRVKGSGCPYCAGKRILPGYNDLATTHPDVAAEWHPTLNKNLSPDSVGTGSKNKVWWLGRCGHEWEAAVGNRSKGIGCPVCTNHLFQPSTNDLATIHPDLAAEWHPTFNIELPSHFSVTSSEKVHWLGECGHSWEASISSRVKGAGCLHCSGKKILPGFNDLATIHPHVVHIWHESNPDISNYTKQSGRKMQWVCGEGHEWEARVACVASGKSHCPECTRKNFTSQPEKQINNYIQQTHKTTTRDRRALPGHEIDIYIPDKKIGIEFNGLYWHTENNGKHRTYHHSKWLAAKNAGIQLIQIWEDDWKHDPELIKRMLDHKLGVTQQRVVYARKTTLTTLNTEQARRFLETNHIQNFASGTYYLGLEDLKEKELVAVLVLKKEAGTDGRTLNIIRYATSCNVVGGFTKLLKHAERTHKPDSFITFADHTVSDGGLYENNGFTPDKQIPPDYTYMVNNKRKHKFSYRLKRFREDPTLEYRDGLTERELAALNNIPRIWDAGKTRYRKTITENSAENK